MDYVDTDKLALFQNDLKKLASDCEENWYLVKHVLAEMDMDDLFYNPSVIQELYEAQIELERLMDVFNALKQVSANLSEEYEDLLLKHQKIIDRMADDALGLKAIGQGLLKPNVAQRADLTYSYTAPTKEMLLSQFGQLEVGIDES